MDEPPPGYAPTVEQEELRDSLRKFLGSTTTESVVRTLVDTPGGFDRATWMRLGSEIGAFGLSVAEDLGGAGAGLVEQAIACEEFGRSLLPGPVFGTVDLAIPLLAALGDDQVLPSVIGGQCTASVALPHSGMEFDPQSIRVAESHGLLTGEVPQVVDGDADLLVVAAKRSEGFGLFLVDGADRVRLPTLDQTRRQVRICFDGVQGSVLATGAGAHHAVQRALCVGTALLAAEQLGEPKGFSSCALNTRERVGSSVDELVRSKRSSTGALTCSCSWNMLVRRHIMRSVRFRPARMIPGWCRAWLRQHARKPFCPLRTAQFRFMGASGLHGSIPHTSTSNVQSQTRHFLVVLTSI